MTPSPLPALRLAHESIGAALLRAVNPLYAIDEALASGSVAGVVPLMSALADDLERAAALARASTKTIEPTLRYRGGKSRI